MKCLLQVLLCTVFMFASQNVLAESTLKRASFLGLIPESAQAGDAVIVSQLHPQGSAHALGLKVGDQLSVVNGRAIADFPALIAVLRDINEGDKLTLEVLRDNKPVELTATAQGRAKEQGEGYRVAYDEFTWQQERIRTISYYPEKPRDDKAAVLFIQGYTCDSIDYGMIPDVSLTQLLSRYAQAGFTVMKMEKPGVGDSEGQLSCQQYDFATENRAFLAGLDHLKTYTEVNADNVFVFGHSLGVLHAAIIAEQGAAKGVIGYGGVVKPWIDYVHDLYGKQSVKYWGVSQSQASNNVKLMSPLLKQWLASDMPWSAVVASDAAKRAIDADLIAIRDELIMDRHYSFFRSVNTFDFQALWSRAKSHALMLHGNYDIQAIEGSWAKEVAELVSNNNGVTGQSLTFERTDHSLMQFKNKTDLMRTTRRQAQGLGRFNQDIASSSIQWMENILSSQLTASASE